MSEQNRAATKQFMMSMLIQNGRSPVPPAQLLKNLDIFFNEVEAYLDKIGDKRREWLLSKLKMKLYQICYVEFGNDVYSFFREINIQNSKEDVEALPNGDYIVKINPFVFFKMMAAFNTLGKLLD